MKIVSATLSDLNRIITLHRQLSLPNPPHDYCWDNPNWLRSEVKEGNLWLLRTRTRQKNYTQGAMCLQLDCLEDPDEAYITTLVIDPKKYRRGFGRRLVEFAKTRAKKAGKTLLIVESLCKYHAEEFYKKCGFRQEPVKSFYHQYPFHYFDMKLNHTAK